jgi:anti-sigma-K factor RskA
MTEPTDFELIELATPYALHAVSVTEQAEIDARVAAAPAPVAAAFNNEVRAVRETMAALAATSIVDPPDHLRAAILALAAPVAVPTIHQSRWRTGVFAAAATIAVGLGAFGLGVVLRPEQVKQTQSVAEQIMSAPDARAVSRPLGAGTATVVFSHDRNAGVLVMNNVPPPSPGTVYQMWLLGANGPTSAGTMGTDAVSPSTKATLDNLGNSTGLAFTVEPGGGSPQPTGTILAQLPFK